MVTHEQQVEIPYAHLISLLLPRNLAISYENKVLVREGILLGVINGDNQSALLNGIYNYGNNFYLKNLCGMFKEWYTNITYFI